MNHGVNGIAGIEGVGSGECLSDHHFIVAAGLGKPSSAEEKEIELGSIGSREISVISATFSRAVRLGIRL
jgi:hypothetical protein